MAGKGKDTVKRIMMIMSIPGVLGVYVNNDELVIYVRHGMRDAILSRLSELKLKYKLSLIEVDGFEVV